MKEIITITKLFEGKEIRSIWDSEKEDYYFSVIDVIYALTESQNPRRYWSDLKSDLEKEGSQLYAKIVQLKLRAKDGKNRITDTLDTEGIFRLIESVPSGHAEPFKLWLAKLGKERIGEIYDPEKAITRAINYYRRMGYDEDWINKRIKGIQDRKKLTDVWKENGINEEYQYAILTDDIYKEWSNMSSKEYKESKGLRKENLRDNMDNIELILTDLSEEATKRLAAKQKPNGLKENIKVAKMGGHAAKVARDDIEKYTNSDTNKRQAARNLEMYFTTLSYNYGVTINVVEQ